MRIDGTRSNDRTTEAVLGYYAAFNRGDWDGMLALLADDVVHDLNQGPREIGKPAFAAFLARMQRSYREQLQDVVVMASPDGARAAAEYVVHGQYLQVDPGPADRTTADGITADSPAPGSRTAAGRPVEPSPLPAARGQRYRLPGGAFFEVRAGLITRVTSYYNFDDWVAQVR